MTSWGLPGRGLAGGACAASRTPARAAGGGAGSGRARTAGAPAHRHARRSAEKEGSWSWTTASTWWTPRRVWWRPCLSPARICASWLPAGNPWCRRRGRLVGASLSVPDGEGRPLPGACEATRRCGCSWIAPRLRLPGFELTAENAEAVARICRRLDGMPLAIELAAARMGALAAEQVAQRLEDSLKLLTGGGRTAEPRHQTLAGDAGLEPRALE